MNYDGQDLNHAPFYGKDLSGSSFVGANLTGANLVGANIAGCDFTDALMHYCNPKNATGADTAIFTGAKIFGMPKWIETPGADDVTLPPVNLDHIDIVYVEAITQAGLTLDVLSEDDARVLEDGYGEVTGTYGLVPHAQKLYEVCFDDDDGVTEVELSVILNAIIEKNIYFANGEFHANN